jgi:general transcription factor 3C polypeptide 3 (transcription factor C subunit 4)
MEVFDQALVFYEPLLNVAEYLDAALLVQIGRCFLRTGKIDLAEQTFRDAVELDGDETEARMELAKIHENRHELHTAMNLVNEVMLLRRDQHRRAPEKQSAAVDTEITKKPARSRVPRASRDAKESKEPKESSIGQRVKADKRLEILSKGEELISHFQVFRNERDRMMAGDRQATTAWLSAAKALTDDFRGCKAFYPWDKYVTFMGYSGDSALHAATPLDADLTGIAERLSKSLFPHPLIEMRFLTSVSRPRGRYFSA